MAKNYRIAVIPGDGTGLEVVNEGKKALQAAANRFGFILELTDFDLGGDRYLRTGEVMNPAKLSARNDTTKRPKEWRASSLSRRRPCEGGSSRADYGIALNCLDFRP